MIDFQPTQADYVAASRANYLSTWRTWRGRSRLLTIAIIVIAMLAGGDWLASGRVDAFWPAWLAMIVVLVPIGIAVNLLLIPRKVRSLFAQQPGYHERMTVTWDGEGFAINSPMTSHRLEWRRLVRWRETRESFLLYPSETGCLFVPKRALDEASLADFRERLHSR